MIAIKSPEKNYVPYPLERWTVSRVTLKVVGQTNTNAENCINSTISTINSLTSNLQMNRDDASNRPDITINIVPDAQIIARGFDGGGYIFNSEVNGNLTESEITLALDSFGGDEMVVCHLIRHEMTHSLGLRFNGDGIDYSIFDVPTDTTAEYLVIDKDLIKMMYNTGINVNINETQARAFLATTTW